MKPINTNNIIIQTPKGRRAIGPNQPVFMVAEISANHNQSYDQALKIIEAAAKAGVDAVKLQTYTADTMTIDCDNEYFQIKVNDAWKNQTLYQLYQKAYTPWDWQPKLKDYAAQQGLLLFSTPFDATAVDFLEERGINELYKVASFELINLPLLRKIGQTNRPVIMSCGMASEAEINLAVKTLKDGGSPQVALLHCISSYPAKPAEMNLATIPDLAQKFQTIVGLSDHSLSNEVALTAVALGAAIIEKHFTLSRKAGGPDAAFSVEPAELTGLVKEIRRRESNKSAGAPAELPAAIGRPSYGTGEGQAPALGHADVGGRVAGLPAPAEQKLYLCVLQIRKNQFLLSFPLRHIYVFESL